MGYTDYWYAKSFKEFPQKFVNQMKSLEEIAKKKKIDCTFEFEKDCIIVNGPCESMVFHTNIQRQPWEKERKDGGILDFCKTRAEPYDAIVKAAIMAAIENGIATEWDFDGVVSQEEYANALEIAREAGIKECPPTIDDKYEVSEEEYANALKIIAEEEAETKETPQT